MSSITRKRLNHILIVLVILTLAFIWFNSFMSRDDSSDISQGLLAWICQVLGKLGIYMDTTEDHWLRKLAHFCEFGMLGVELCLLMFINNRQRLQGFANCAFAGLATAVTDESIQLISKRGSQVQDILLDFCGFLTGLLLCGLICALVVKKRNKA
jgi:VanZ family protein